MEPDEIHPKIKYLPSNKCFINEISKLFEKCIEYEMIPYIWKTAILMLLRKNKKNYIFRKYLPTNFSNMYFV